MTQGSHGGAVPRSREKGSKEEVDEPSRQAGPLKRRFERPRASTQLTFAEGSIDAPLNGSLTGFGPSSESYRAQTFVALDERANSLTVYLKNQTGSGPIQFRVLVTEFTNTNGFHPTNILFQSKISLAPFGGIGSPPVALPFTLDLVGLALEKGKSYAWILDSFVTGIPTPPLLPSAITGISSSGIYPQGIAYSLRSGSGGTITDHFALNWIQDPFDRDWAFKMDFSPTPPNPISEPFTDLLGDKDGFGMGLRAGDLRPVGLTPFSFDNREADDPLFTDVWPVPTVGTFPSGSFSYSHTWSPSGGKPIASAKLRMLTSGIQDGDRQVVGSDTDLRLFIDNVEVPKAFDDVDQFDFFPGIGFAEIVGPVHIEIPENLFPLLADGQAEIRIESHQLGTAPSMEGFAIDYSKFFVLFNLNDKFGPLGPGDVVTAFSFTPCGGASVGTFTITATFTNISSDTLSNLVVAVNTLTGGNVLCNADGGPGGTGSQLTVPLQGDLADGQLSPGEAFVVELPVGLQSFNPFTFVVDVLGVEAP